jgi:hypothetical protein
MAQRAVAVRHTEGAGSACSEVSRSNVVANSVDSQIYVDNSTRSTRVSNKKEQNHTTEQGTGKNHDGTIPFNVRAMKLSLQMLVCTWVQISMLMLSLMPDKIPIKKDKQLEIIGMTKDTIKLLGSTELTLREDFYKFQVAPEEIHLNEDGLIGRDIFKGSIIHNKEGYIYNYGYKFPFCVQQVENITLKLRRETIVVCVHLLTHCLLTPRSTTLPQTLTVSKPVKKLPAFYETRSFINAFTSNRHLP